MAKVTGKTFLDVLKNEEAKRLERRDYQQDAKTVLVQWDVQNEEGDVVLSGFNQIKDTPEEKESLKALKCQEAGCASFSMMVI